MAEELAEGLGPLEADGLERGLPITSVSSRSASVGSSSNELSLVLGLPKSSGTPSRGGRSIGGHDAAIWERKEGLC